MDEAVILSAVRTPIGTLGGALAPLGAVDLGARAVAAALDRAGIGGEDVDEVVMGNVIQAGVGLNPARQMGIGAGVDEAVPATTINMACASGLQSVVSAARAVAAGESEAVVAGGAESMSNAPYLLDKARTGYRLGHGELLDSLLRDGLWCALTDVHMGGTAENVAREFEVTRADQDAFAATSQARAADAVAAGRMAPEIVPVDVPQRRGDPVEVSLDEHPRPDTTLEGLARLRPVFEREGTVTAGNASGINDGAAALVVSSAEAAERAGVEPLARIVASASVGVPPRIMGIGPIAATRKVLSLAGLEVGDLDLVELNEAFAAQALAVIRELDLDPERVNVNGGAIALGHPVGASGARVLVTLLHEMRRRDVRRGLATLCVGGGQGIAMIVERPLG